MKPKTYDLVTNLCVFVAVGSALVFDYSGSWKWLVGFVAIAAAVVSVVSYLRTHYEEQKLERQNQSAETPESSSGRVSHVSTLEVEDTPCQIFSAKASAKDLSPSHVTAYAAWLGKSVEYSLYEASLFSSRAAEAASVIKRVTSEVGGHYYEFVFTKDGSIIIRPARVRAISGWSLEEALEEGEMETEKQPRQVN